MCCVDFEVMFGEFLCSARDTTAIVFAAHAAVCELCFWCRLQEKNERQSDIRAIAGVCEKVSSLFIGFVRFFFVVRSWFVCYLRFRPFWELFAPFPPAKGTKM